MANNSVVWLLVGLAVNTYAAESPPDLNITLGEHNTGVGLKVPSGGDGVNTFEEIDGAPARRVQGDRSLYLYVVVDHPAYAQGPVDAYVTVEVFDDTFGRILIQYDRDSPAPDISTKYTSGNDTMLLPGSRQWRRATFHLPALRLGHGQNGGADFRLQGRYAFRNITLTTRRPAGYDPQQPLDPDALRSLTVERPPGMELTFGNDASPADAAIFRALSVTSVADAAKFIADCCKKQGVKA